MAVDGNKEDAAGAFVQVNFYAIGLNKRGMGRSAGCAGDQAGRTRIGYWMCGACCMYAFTELVPAISIWASPTYIQGHGGGGHVLWHLRGAERGRGMPERSAVFQAGLSHMHFA